MNFGGSEIDDIPRPIVNIATVNATANTIPNLSKDVIQFIAKSMIKDDHRIIIPFATRNSNSGTNDFSSIRPD